MRRPGVISTDRCEFYMWMEGEAIYSLVTKKRDGDSDLLSGIWLVLIDELSVW